MPTGCLAATLLVMTVLDFFGKDLLFQDLELVCGQDAGIGVLADLNPILEYADCRAEARLNNAFERLSAEAPDDDFWLVRV